MFLNSRQKFVVAEFYSTCVQVYEKWMRLYMEKLGLTAAAGDEIGDGRRVVTEVSELNERYMRLVTELHQRLTHIKAVYDDAGVYFPVRFTAFVLLLWRVLRRREMGNWETWIK